MAVDTLIIPPACQDFMDMMYTYDTETAEHCKRVAVLCSKMSKKLGYARSDSLYNAALVHDIGKVLIPIDILHKRSKLDRLERLLINSHAHWGYEILSVGDLTEIERQFVLYHHGFTNFPIYAMISEGSATVTKCADNDILEGSLILQAADIYDAVTTERPYHKAQEPEVAIEALFQKHIPIHIINTIDIYKM